MTKHRDKDSQRRRVMKAWLELQAALTVATEDGDHRPEWTESVSFAKDHCEKALKLDP